ncbi:MAG TPA: hypothetical protein VI094_04710 [Propionibacteriaceae bacterium]
MSQSSITPLASGRLNGQTLTIELVEPGNDLPNAVVVKWPVKPTISRSAAFDKVVADAMKILSKTRSSNWLPYVCGKGCERRRSPGRGPPAAES